MFAVAEENLATPRKSRGVRYRLRASDTRHGHGTPEKNARGISRRAPRLQRGSCLSTSQRLHYDSYTQISQYLRCPRSYRYRYLDGWREKETRAPMVFGRSFENALGALFRKEDPGAALFTEWGAYRNAALEYKKGDTWDVSSIKVSICWNDLRKMSEFAFKIHRTTCS